MSAKRTREFTKSSYSYAKSSIHRIGNDDTYVNAQTDQHLCWFQLYNLGF